MDGADDFNPFQGHQGLNDGNNTDDAYASAENDAAAGDGGAGRVIARDRENIHVPISSVARIMRRALPSQAKISDDAKWRIQACVAEYIGFITSEANERCHAEQRKIITAEDLIWAMAKLGFDDYVGPLTTFLRKYREAEGSAGSTRVSGRIYGSSLPAVSERSGSATGLLPMQPTGRMPMPMPPMEPHMDGLPQQQLNMSPFAGMNVGFHHHQQQQQQQQPWVYEDHFSAYGDGTHDGSSSGPSSSFKFVN